MSFRSTLLSISFLAASVLPTATAAGQNINEELSLLDATIEMAQDYYKNKETLITSLESLLNYPNTSLEQKFTIYGQLFNENYSYSFAKALNAIDNQENIAKSLGERDRQQVTLDRALLYATAGMYLEAKEVIDTKIDTTKLNEKQMQDYFYLMQRYWKDYTEYSEINDRNALVEYFRERYIERTDESDFKHRQLIIFNLMDRGNIEEADKMNRELLSSIDSLSHDYAIMSYYQGLICEYLGDNEGKLHWLIKSAITDIKNAVKDYASLSSIATALLDTDVERSSHYIQVSIEDALFYNAKLRPLQIARLMPNIDSAYKKKQEDTQIRATHRITELALLSALLLAVAIILGYLLKRQTDAKKNLKIEIEQSRTNNETLSKENEDIRDAFQRLSISDDVKREQVVVLLNSLNVVLDKAKKNLTQEQREYEIKQYYSIFDSTFLQMYPTFVEDFNALLKPEARIDLKKEDILSTELRIFALIKLGVTQSSAIAHILKYSVNTIYNYRAQIKNAALDDREDFEDSVKNIGNIDI